MTIGEGVARNVAYYVIAHAAKFIRPGSVRIHSDGQVSLPNAAFLTPAGGIVMIVLNDGAEFRSFKIRFQGKNAVATLAGSTVATYVWRAN